MMYLQAALSLLAGLLACIPLVLKLVEKVREAVEARNWAALMRIVIELMEEAERLYTDGASRKEYVMAQAEAAARLVNYEWNEDTSAKVSDMIDTMCAMAKVVNTGRKKKSVTVSTEV